MARILVSLVLLLVFFVLSNKPGLAGGPARDGRDLKHGPAVDSGDLDLPNLTREQRQKSYRDALSAIRLPAVTAKKTVRVYALDFNPQINGTSLVQNESWYDPTQLMQVYSAELQQASADTIGFQIVKHSIVNGFPAKPDGFVFTNDVYLACLKDGSGPHCSPIIDYQTVLNTAYDASFMSACDAVASGAVDEVWLWGGPFFGYWEYVRIPPQSLCPNVNAGFTVMGFSYERADSEMLHDMGHRAEQVLQDWIGLPLWDRFDGQRQRYEQDILCPSAPDVSHPEVNINATHLGNVHFPPNAYCHYQYNRDMPIISDAADWMNYPALSGDGSTINRVDWNSDQRGFMLWWFGHFPRNDLVPGADWWEILFARQAIQKIRFDTSGAAIYGGAPYLLTATASSGLAVTYSVAGPCSIDGNVLVPTAAGTCHVVAQQAGNLYFLPAADARHDVGILAGSSVYFLPSVFR